MFSCPGPPLAPVPPCLGTEGCNRLSSDETEGDGEAPGGPEGPDCHPRPLAVSLGSVPSKMGAVGYPPPSIHLLTLPVVFLSPSAVRSGPGWWVLGAMRSTGAGTG